MGRSSLASLRYIASRVARSGVEHTWLREHMCWRVPTSYPAVALTFDDGPHPEFTPRILDVLSAHHAHATFFAVGECARRYPEIVKRIVHEGHSLGSHTDTHCDLARIPSQQALQECGRGRETLEQISGGSVIYLRPPWGRITLRNASALVRSYL